MPEKSIVCVCGGGGMYEVGGGWGVYGCGVCMCVCICVLYVGGGEGGAWVHMTKCGIGGWASGWGGRQTDRQR